MRLIHRGWILEEGNAGFIYASLRVLAILKKAQWLLLSIIVKGRYNTWGG